MLVTHEVTQHNQNPLTQESVGGKLFFYFICNRQLLIFLQHYAFFFMLHQIMQQCSFLLASTLTGRSQVQILASLKKKTSVQMPQSVTSTGESESQSSSITITEFSTLGSFYDQQQWSAMAYGSFLSRSCYLETKSRKFRHQGELRRMT